MDPSSPIDLKPDVGDSLTSNPSSSTMETAVKTEPSTSQDADTSDEILDVEGDVKPSTSGESPIKSDNDNSKEETKTESNQEERESGQEQSKSGSSSPEKRDRDEREEELQAHRNKKAKQDEERTKMQVLVSNFSEDQLNRYEMFRRAAFPKASIKRLMQNITGSTVSPNVVIAMSGIAKVYVGEIVETALDVMENWEERQGPIQPKHLREAVRRIKNQGGIPTTKYQKKLLR